MLLTLGNRHNICKPVAKQRVAGNFIPVWRYKSSAYLANPCFYQEVRACTLCWPASRGFFLCQRLLDRRLPIAFDLECIRLGPRSQLWPRWTFRLSLGLCSRHVSHYLGRGLIQQSFSFGSANRQHGALAVIEFAVIPEEIELIDVAP